MGHFIEELNSSCRRVGQVCVINKQSLLFLCLYKIICLTGLVHPHSGSPRNVWESTGGSVKLMRERSWMLETYSLARNKCSKMWPLGGRVTWSSLLPPSPTLSWAQRELQCTIPPPCLATQSALLPAEAAAHPFPQPAFPEVGSASQGPCDFHWQVTITDGLPVSKTAKGFCAVIILFLFKTLGIFYCCQ